MIFRSSHESLLFNPMLTVSFGPNIVVNDTKYFGLTTNGFRLAPPVSMGDEYAERFGKWHGHDGIELLILRDGKRKAVFFTFVKERTKSTLSETPDEN